MRKSYQTSPRSDCRYLPKEQFDDAKRILKALSSTPVFVAGSVLLTEEPDRTVADVAHTLRSMHDKFGYMYPELKHTWSSLERTIDRCLDKLE